ncbi:MAG: ABC transporter ATP-binding protein, partial [Propionibacteriaceae bacterium]
IGAPITMIGGVIQGVREAWRLSWLIVAAVVVLGVGIGILITSVSPLFSKLQNLIDGLNRVLREQITGIRVVRAFVREETEAQRFDVANRDIAVVQTRVGRFMATLFPFVMLVMNVSSVGVLWFGSRQIDAGKLQIGQQTAFLNYLMQILMSVMMTTMLVFMVPRAKVCAERINEVLDTESTVVWPDSGRTDLSGNGHLRLTDVSFTFPGAEHPVLDKVSFEIKTGETTAIIGSTGSGKSTLVNLIPRLYDATSGTVEIDDVNVKEADPDTLWAHVGLVPQKPYLFTGTIASNLRYGNPTATDDEIWQALDVAQAADFVREMPDGLNTAIAQGGTNVSGGQRQRLAIARALIKKPDIYVFDDSFSALDVATDARLRAALATETKDAAVLIVAQRVSTIMGADHIIVLEDGEIVGQGTHTELLAGNETYQEIVESQFKTQEVAA